MWRRAAVAESPASPSFLQTWRISLASGTFVVLSEFLRFRKMSRPMYRCYFLQNGRIAQGCNVKVATLDAAIATGRKMLADHISIDDYDGLEIWLDQALLYKFGD
jgi:hypothetical protein